MKPMQHHSLPPRPRHLMHQGHMHPGHPPPPPHMAINMGPPPPPQQQPHHMPTAPPPRGPLSQQYNLPQMRDQNRLGHHQHLQQHTQQRLNNQIQPNQMQHPKGRSFNAKGNGGPQVSQGSVKHGGMQKSRPPAPMRNNSVHKPPQLHQQPPKLPPPQALRGPPQQPIPMVGGCAPQMPIMNSMPQPPLHQHYPQQQQQGNTIPQVPQQNAHMPRPLAPTQPQQQKQQHHKQLQNEHQLTPQRQQHYPQLQQQNHQQHRFSHPTAISQNSPRGQSKSLNRHNNQSTINPVNTTVLPPATHLETSTVVSVQMSSITHVSSDKLSPTAQDFTPQSAQKAPLGQVDEKVENENGGLFNILSAVMKDDGCFSNSKEKTPMCMINELARYNKIHHQYRLTDESGPAHCKRFTVTLKLGDEEYTAEGFKIKKAQHAAAAEAVKHTKYEHPLPKVIRRPEETLRATITPTVELNALAMKLGQQTYYVLDQSSNPSPSVAPQGLQIAQPINPFHIPRLPRNAAALQHQQRFIPGRGFPPKFPGLHGRVPALNGMMGYPPQLAHTIPPELCRITLFVGKQKFVGTGRTLQSAKHDAASRALLVLKNQAANKFKEILTQTAEEGDWKSPISLVHEIAIKRNLSVNFKVLREEGPAHMKSFITICEVGDIVTEGDGNGKKSSKKRAAEKMLEELKKLPPPSPSKSPPVKRLKVKNSKQKNSPSMLKKKGGSSIREKTESECAEDANPISRLIQIQQSRNEKEPLYELISKTGESKKREFVMEVSIPGKSARGLGPSKKLAKRNAAQNLLIEMGFELENNQENDSQVANINMRSKEVRKNALIENCSVSSVVDTNPTTNGNGNGGPSGRQIVPGVLLLHQHSKDSNDAEHSAETIEVSAAGNTTNPPISSTPSEVQADCPAPNKDSGTVVRPKDQLFYLAQILGFQANFSDYPKGNHSEFLTIVTLSTSPPQICHGIGLNIEESQDQAASAALQILSKLGLDNIKPKQDD